MEDRNESTRPSGRPEPQILTIHPLSFRPSPSTQYPAPSPQHFIPPTTNSPQPTLPGWVSTIYVTQNGIRRGPYYVRKWKKNGKTHREYIKPQDLERVRAACQAHREIQARKRQKIREFNIGVDNFNFLCRMGIALDKGPIHFIHAAHVIRIHQQGITTPHRPKLRKLRPHGFMVPRSRRRTTKRSVAFLGDVLNFQLRLANKRTRKRSTPHENTPKGFEKVAGGRALPSDTPGRDAAPKTTLKGWEELSNNLPRTAHREQPTNGFMVPRPRPEVQLVAPNQSLQDKLKSEICNLQSESLSPQPPALSPKNIASLKQLLKQFQTNQKANQNPKTQNLKSLKHPKTLTPAQRQAEAEIDNHRAQWPYYKDPGGPNSVPASRILYHASRIPYPVSRIPKPTKQR